MKGNDSSGRRGTGKHAFGRSRARHRGGARSAGVAVRVLDGRYALSEPLGYGAISEVHHARDTHSGQDVAVKMLRADLAGDPTSVERFRGEAQHAMAFEHPGIVAVRETGLAGGEFAGVPYVVMEYVAGRTLRRIVTTGGPMPQHRAATVIVDVCAALDFAHRKGFVHGDVKPANVMIDRGGAVKVMDFGVIHTATDGGANSGHDYCSPEQARGEPVNARSDVYAAGCVLLEMLTGTPPSAGDWPVPTDGSTPPRASSNPAVGPVLEPILRTAMAHRPEDRYPTAGAMRAAVLATGLIRQPDSRTAPAPNVWAPTAAPAAPPEPTTAPEPTAPAPASAAITSPAFPPAATPPADPASAPSETVVPTAFTPAAAPAAPAAEPPAAVSAPAVPAPAVSEQDDNTASVLPAPSLGDITYPAAPYSPATNPTDTAPSAYPPPTADPTAPSPTAAYAATDAPAPSSTAPSQTAAAPTAATQTAHYPASEAPTVRTAPVAPPGQTSRPGQRPTDRTRRRRGRPRPGVLALTGIAGVIVGLGLAALLGGFGGGGSDQQNNAAAGQRGPATAAPQRQVAVPANLTGMSLADATRALQSVGLQVAPNPTRAPVDDPALIGAVTAASPPAGAQIAPGSVITLTVGTKPPTVTVPNEVGQTQQQASTDLQDRGLQVAVQQADGTQPAGTVVSQDPTGGDVAPGSQVTLTVSTGTAPTTSAPPSSPPPGPAPPPGQPEGQRGPDGRGTYLCTPAMLSYAACNPDTLGKMVEYPSYDGH